MLVLGSPALAGPAWSYSPGSLHSVPALLSHSSTEFSPKVNAHIQLFLRTSSRHRTLWVYLSLALGNEFAFEQPDAARPLIPKPKPLSLCSPIY